MGGGRLDDRSFSVNGWEEWGAAKYSSGGRHLKVNQYNICKDDNWKNSYVVSTPVVLNYEICLSLLADEFKAADV